MGQPWVFVVSRDGEPMGLAHPAVVRMWRRKGKARMRRVGVNVVRLTCRHAEACFERKTKGARADIGVDPGAKTSGLSLAVDGKVVWTAEVHHRSSVISKRMTARKQCRSARRCRRKRAAQRAAKPARWQHRTKKAGWLAPSVYHRVQSLRRWIRWLAQFASPMVQDTVVHVEVNAFDTHKAVNPDVEGEGYQRGALWRAHLRGYVMTRDKRRCVYCERKGERVKFQLDHVIAASSGGSDRHWNRVCACKPCNAAKSNASLETWLATTAPPAVKDKGKDILHYVEEVAQGRIKLSAMAAATVVGPCLVKKLKAEAFAVETSSGADTAAWRAMARVTKSHVNDAACTAAKGGGLIVRCERALSLHVTGRGRRLVVKRNGRGMPRRRTDGAPIASHRGTPPHGFRAGDMVRIDTEGVGRRRRFGVLRCARHDGGCDVQVRSGKPRKVSASKLTLLHRTLGVRVA